MGARDPNRRRDEREFIVGKDPSTGEPLGLLCPKVPDAELPPPVPSDPVPAMPVVKRRPFRNPALMLMLALSMYDREPE